MKSGFLKAVENAETKLISFDNSSLLNKRRGNMMKLKKVFHKQRKLNSTDTDIKKTMNSLKTNIRKNVQRRRNSILHKEIILHPRKNITTILPSIPVLEVNRNQTKLPAKNRTKEKRKLSKLNTNNIQRGWSHIDKIGAIFIGAEQYQFKGLNNNSKNIHHSNNGKHEKGSSIKRRTKTSEKRLHIKSDELIDTFNHLSRNDIHTTNGTNNQTFNHESQKHKNKTLEGQSSLEKNDKKIRQNENRVINQKNQKIVKKTRNPFESLKIKSSIDKNTGQENEKKKNRMPFIHDNKSYKESQIKRRQYKVDVNKPRLNANSSTTIFKREETKMSATAPNVSLASTSQLITNKILQPHNKTDSNQAIKNNHMSTNKTKGISFKEEYGAKNSLHQRRNIKRRINRKLA